MTFPGGPAEWPTPPHGMPPGGPPPLSSEPRGPFTPPPGPAEPGFPPGTDFGGPQRERGSRRKAVLIGVGALALLAVVGSGGYFGYQAISAPEPVSAAPVPTPPPGDPGPADSRVTSILNTESTDPKALTLAEAFPDRQIEVSGATFTRVKTAMTMECDTAATGAFATALRDNKCSRVLRATYVDAKKRYAITTGIAVLPSLDDALHADKAKNLMGNVWFRPLPGSAASGADRVHIAGGYASGLVWGRYIVFSYATNADGHTPTPKETGLGKVSGGFRDTTALVLERRITG
ncbi:hypothetical protein [Microtetraspora sp. NBRC 13810]|uniref:hypothetical protein n=1 Tax=Microtetraspora sp. NBRC 13810 TaxID=3030990 RepID=UPI0025548DBE|nr:hypothetical protein [Microtetraspora sp. NBRC 13810]